MWVLETCKTAGPLLCAKQLKKLRGCLSDTASPHWEGKMRLLNKKLNALPNSTMGLLVEFVGFGIAVFSHIY